jgi:hypothetical protein
MLRPAPAAGSGTRHGVPQTTCGSKQNLPPQSATCFRAVPPTGPKRWRVTQQRAVRTKAELRAARERVSTYHEARLAELIEHIAIALPTPYDTTQSRSNALPMASARAGSCDANR